MKEAEIEQMIKDILREGSLCCEDAHELSKKEGISMAEIGRIADKLDIKIKACQLGCF